jgi:hypothetical protein
MFVHVVRVPGGPSDDPHDDAAWQIMAGSLRGQPRGKRSSSHPNKQAEIGLSKQALRCDFLLSN